MISLDQSAFMVTYGGKEFRLFAPRAEDVDIHDIAHALSNLCRFTGHTKKFYSVAEHCVWASWYAQPENQLAALVHDASEAYINDLSRPLKHHPNMSAYVETEDAIEKVIAQKFCLAYPLKNADIENIDRRLVVSEARALIANPFWADGHPPLDGFRPRCWNPQEAEARFLMRYDFLRKV